MLNLYELEVHYSRIGRICMWTTWRELMRLLVPCLELLLRLLLRVNKLWLCCCCMLHFLVVSALLAHTLTPHIVTHTHTTHTHTHTHSQAFTSTQTHTISLSHTLTHIHECPLSHTKNLSLELWMRVMSNVSHNILSYNKWKCQHTEHSNNESLYPLSTPLLKL